MGWLSNLLSRRRSQQPELQLKAPKKGGKRTAKITSRYFTCSDQSVSVDGTFGLIRFAIHEAELPGADRGRDYFAVLSVGAQTLVSRSARPSKAAPAVSVAWGGQGSNFVLQRGGATVARVAVYRAGRLDGALGNKLVAWCTVDLASYFTGDEGTGDDDDLKDDLTDDLKAELSSESAGGGGGKAPAAPRPGSGGSGREEDAGPAPADMDPGRESGGEDEEAYLGEEVETWVDLTPADPNDPHPGRIRLSGRAASCPELERQLWRRLLPLADWSGNGCLELEEFSHLLKSFGSDLSEEEVAQLFADVDVDGSGSVETEELAAALASRHLRGQFYRLMRRCPVDGAELTPGEDFSNVIYIHLALDRGTGDSLKGGFVTSTQASRAWMLSLSEWVTRPLAGKDRYRAGGLRTGAAARHILVFDRASKMVVEEKISPVLALAMRQMYQSRVGRLLQGEGLYKQLAALSEREGRYADTEESVKEIAPFLAEYADVIDTSEIEGDVSSFNTFNKFFYRKLRAGARPVAHPGQPEVVVSGADCRLMVYETVDAATRFWIKGRRFSLAGLLADTDPERPLSAPFTGGSLVILRLAPQDYHRFHSPVAGVVRSVADVPGQLLTVNPVAVNSTFANVFTENKRSVMVISTQEFGDVAFVAIGATIVGSINWTVAVGDEVAKGAELGFFAFGGSTCIVVFGPGQVSWDVDLVENGLKSLETLVRVGERIGAKAGSAFEQPPEEPAAALERSETLRHGGVKPLEERPELQAMLHARSSSASAVLLSPLEDSAGDLSAA